MLYDQESERNVLAIMLSDEQGLITAMYELSEQDFYDPKNQALFKIMGDLYSQSIKPTYLEVCKEAKRAGVINDSQVVEDIAALYITSETIGYWIKNVKDAAKRRQLKSVLLAGEDMLKSNKDLEELMSDFESAVIALRATDNQAIESGKDLAEIGRKAFQEALENKGKLTGIHTGLGRLNRLTGGWKPGDLIILAAETGKGKTAFSLNFINISAIWLQKPTLYINSEMSRRQVVFRLASIISQLKNDVIKFGEANDLEQLGYEGAMKMIEQAPLFHYWSPAMDLKNVISAIRKMKIQQNIELVILDYVGRMEKGSSKDFKEWQVLEQIVKALKTLAQELNIAVMVVAQLTDDQKLQGARRMENEADVFLRLLPMTDEQLKENANRYKCPPNYLIHVKKNRDGMADVYVPTLFDKPTLRVVDVANPN